MNNPGLFVVALPWLVSGLLGVFCPEACAQLNTAMMRCFGMDSGLIGNPRVVRIVSAVALVVAIILIAIQLAIGFEAGESRK